jgi:signal transduction histidine kinase
MKIIIVTFFYLFTCFSFAQKACYCNANDRINLVNERDSVEVFKVSNKLKYGNNKACLFKALEIELNFFLIQKKLDKVIETINKLEDLLTEINCENELTFNIYLCKAKYYRVKNDYEKLSEFAFKALREAERLKNSEKEIESIKEIVYLFTRMGEDHKNWAYIQRAQALIFNQKDAIQSIKNYRWLAFEYEKKYTTTGRKSLLDTVFILAKKSKNDALKHKMYDELAMSYRALEAYAYHKGAFNNAVKYIDSAIYYGKKIKGVKNLGGLYISKAWDHLDLGEKENAVKWMDTALLKTNRSDLAGNMMEYYDASDLYEQAGRLDKAYASFKTYAKMKDSIMNTERTEVINELEAKYKTELKDAQIKKLVVLLIAAAALIVLILLIGTIIQLKKTKQKNEVLKQAFETQVRLEKELTDVRDTIAQDFHDDLGNRLARISLLSNLVNQEVSDKDEKIKTKVKQITDDSNELYAGTRDFIFSLKSNSDFLMELVTYLSDFGEDFFSKTNIKFVLQNNIKEDDKLPYYWSKQLVYIFKEAMTNAFKYSKCDEVILHFKYNNKLLVIECIDNGVGLNEKDFESKNGLLNMKNRAQKIGGALEIVSEYNQGTIIRFSGKTS